MNISNLLTNYKAQCIVSALTTIYWIFGLIIRFFPDIVMPPSKIWFVYRPLVNVLRGTNILCIILLILILYFRTWSLKYTLILLGINILTLLFGLYFIGFPILMM